MPPIFSFNSTTAGTLPAFPPADPTQTRVLVENPLTPGVASWQCLSTGDLCTLPVGFSVELLAIAPGPFEIGATVLNPTFTALYHNGVEITATTHGFRGDLFVRDDGEDLSDHLPLEVTFSWTGTA